jgi:hypothetical protein
MIPFARLRGGIASPVISNAISLCEHLGTDKLMLP